MRDALDGVIVAIALIGLAYFVAPDVRAWIEGRLPVEVICLGR